MFLFKIKGKKMDTEKFILETDSNGNLKQIPKFPPNAQLKIIVLTEKSSPRRKPSSKIAGKGKILGDIMTTMTTEDWNALK